MTPIRSPFAEYLRFLVYAVAVGAVLLLLGYAPTRRLGGSEALPAMAAGCVIGILASAVGAIPVVLARRSGRGSPLQGMLTSMALRFMAVLALGLSAGLSGWFESRPLLIWIAIGYVAQLPLDARYATRGL
jgi:drug/metabolite transporter (DMT)-like permease